MRRLNRFHLASTLFAALFVGTSFAQPPEGERGPGRGERGPGGDERRGPGGERRGPGGERGPGGPGGDRGPGGPGGFRGGPPAEMMMRLPVLAALDANKDGKISSDEIDNATAALRKLDKNDDGSLTQEELRPDPAMFGRGGPGGPGGPGGRPRPEGDFGGGRPDGPAGGDRRGGGNPEETVKRFMQFDKNDDGFLSKDELSERMQSLIARADKNDDGKASREELAAMAASGMNRDRGEGGRPDGDRPGGDRPGGERRGGNPEEMVARIFDSRDTNGDGKLSESEIPEQMAGRIEQIDSDKDGSVSREELSKAMSRMRGGREGAGRGPRDEAGGARPRRPEAE